MEKDHFCSWGLLGFAEKGQTTDHEIESGKVLADVIREQFPDRVAGKKDSAVAVVTEFNDHVDTTFADVERVFEKAELVWDERALTAGD